MLQADLATPPEGAALEPSAGSFGIQAYRSDAQTTQAALPHVGRKELAYIGHLDRVHQCATTSALAAVLCKASHRLDAASCACITNTLTALHGISCMLLKPCLTPA